jgi:hypothetical protein
MLGRGGLQNQKIGNGFLIFTFNSPSLLHHCLFKNIDCHEKIEKPLLKFYC